MTDPETFLPPLPDGDVPTVELERLEPERWVVRELVGPGGVGVTVRVPVYGPPRLKPVARRTTPLPSLLEVVVGVCREPSL